MGLRVRCTEESKPIREGDVCYFYRLRPWGTYPFFTRFLIRGLYKHRGWNTHDGSFESQAVFDTFKTVEEAQRFAKERGWGVQVLPLNQPLPNETCQYGLNDMPSSDARHVTIDRDLELQTVPRRTLEWMLEKLNGLVGSKAAP